VYVYMCTRTYLCMPSRVLLTLCMCYQLRIVSMPIGETCARVKSFNQDDSNSVIINYYQFGTANLRDYTMNELLTVRCL